MNLQKNTRLFLSKGKETRQNFICQGDRCNIPINQITQLTFRSLSSLGDYSHEVQATVQLCHLVLMVII